MMNNNFNNGTANNNNNSNNNSQPTTGTTVEVEGGNFNLWLAVIVATLAILGILVVAL